MPSRDRPGTVPDVIGYLVGTARSHNVVMTSGGVGYVVHAPRPFHAGEVLSLHVSTHTSREGVVTLYGFEDETQQRLFAALTAVSGIGGNTALGLLRELGVARIAHAVLHKDAATLSSVKGVGTKAAEKLVTLAKLPKDLEPLAATGGADHDDPVAAVLIGLGYRAEEAHDALRRVPRDGDSDDARLAAALDEIRKVTR